ncbi:YbgC/FadM family acyl-CoA thioesterase [Aquabacterium sp.]|uniref:YbgC/FadM family acyl-CoA thioesterase n=1 Tax=Aquabacterium sp. TaxID=1872578 RepID=UPI0025B87962|nr:YbgC/FadM family acyl-CoA thioesterase [Aquabacterium sp.]
MSRPDEFSFIHRLRVRWAEVDAQQVVFNAHYLSYLDAAMSDYWREVGLPYPEGLLHVQGDLYMRANSMQYHAPARLDDWLEVGVRCERIGNSSLTMAWAVWAQGRLIVSGEAVYVLTSLADRQPMRVPDSLRAQIEAHASERPVHSVRAGSWDEVGEAARVVRKAVFVGEQGIPESEEWDEDDAEAVHVVACNLAGLPLATGRLIHVGQANGAAKVGRMAVLRSSRGVGLGQLMLETLLEQARARQIQQIALHAQVSAQGFYTRLGFRAEGPVFDEVGIPHQRMTLTL